MTTSVGKEIGNLTALASPIMVTQLSQVGFGVADAVMAGRVSPTDLAGVALGNNLYFPSMLLLSGVLMALTPTVSQLDGAGRASEAGAVARQALWIALLGSLAGMAFLQNAQPLYGWLGIDPQAVPVAADFLYAASFGLFPVLGYFALRYLCEGLSWTQPAMFIAMSALGLKVGLNFVLVYGALGADAMGGVGCGWATALVMWYQLFAMVCVVAVSRIRRSGVFTRFDWPHPATLARLIRLGVPIGGAIFVEVAFFSSVSLMIGRLGVDAVASHQIALNVGGVGFMIPLALGIASTIRVGYKVGGRDFAGARVAAAVAVGASLLVGAVAAVIITLGRYEIAGLYTQDPNVLATTAMLMLICALYQMFDAGQVTAMGALRGLKDTRRPMLIALVSYWALGFPVGYVLTFGGWAFPGMGVYGFWWGMLLGLGTAATVLIARLARLARDETRVEVLAGPG